MAFCIEVQIHDCADLSDNPNRFRKWGQRTYGTSEEAWEAAYAAREEIQRRGTRAFSSGHKTRYYGTVRPRLVTERGRN
jgi:hypothetical protein